MYWWHSINLSRVISGKNEYQKIIYSILGNPLLVQSPTQAFVYQPSVNPTKDKYILNLLFWIFNLFNLAEG